MEWTERQRKRKGWLYRRGKGKGQTGKMVMQISEKEGEQGSKGKGIWGGEGQGREEGKYRCFSRSTTPIGI